MSGMTREEAIVVIWNRCQHCKETEEAIKALKEQMICPILSDDEVKQPCIKSPCGFERLHGEWISCSERLPEENICDDGYVEPSDCVLVFGDHGEYGVSRYWGNRKTKKDNPDSFSDWMDLKWRIQKPIAWMPLPEPYKKEGEAE